ncbi:MAG: DoxX family membrane protein [Pseudomonadota bacterium]
MSVDESGFLNQTLPRASRLENALAEKSKGIFFNKVFDAINCGLGAHWFLRIPLAYIMFQQGSMKTSNITAVAEASGIPVWMYVLAMLAELGGAAALIVGGIVQTWNPGGRIDWMGRSITRLAGFAIAAVATAVIVQFFASSFIAMRDHLLYVFVGLFFLLYGNGYRVSRISDGGGQR